MRYNSRRIYDDCRTSEEAEGEPRALTSWIMHSNVPQMKKLARAPRDDEAEVLAYFGNRLTNAVLEGMNSVIRSARRAARGFRNIEYFKTIIYLKLGKLPLVEATCATRQKRRRAQIYYLQNSPSRYIAISCTMSSIYARCPNNKTPCKRRGS